MDTFEATHLEHSPSRLMMYLRNLKLPMQLGLEITVEGDAIEWRGQAVWNGPEDVDVELTILSCRVCASTPLAATALSPENSLEWKSFTLRR